MNTQKNAWQRIGFCIAATAVLLLPARLAAAQSEYVIQQSLDFGLFGLLHNFTPSDLVVDFNGLYTSDPAFVLTAPYPQNAEISFTGLDPSVPFTVTFNNGTLSLNGGGLPPFLTVRDFTTDGPYNTTPGGTLTIRYGATLRSSGNGVPYQSGPYSGTYDVTFDY